jgi:hypothetical protein
VTGEPTPAVRARYAEARDKIVDQGLVNNV